MVDGRLDSRSLSLLPDPVPRRTDHEGADVDGTPHAATLTEAATAANARPLIAHSEYVPTRSARCHSRMNARTLAAVPKAAQSVEEFVTLDPEDDLERAP